MLPLLDLLSVLCLAAQICDSLLLGQDLTCLHSGRCLSFAVPRVVVDCSGDFSVDHRLSSTDTRVFQVVRCQAYSQIPLDRVVVLVLLDSGARTLPAPSAVVALVPTGMLLDIKPFLCHILAVSSWHAVLICPNLLFRVKVSRFESSDDRRRQACLHLRIKAVLPIIGLPLTNCRLKFIRGECLLGPRVRYCAQLALSLATVVAVSLVGMLKAHLA